MKKNILVTGFVSLLFLQQSKADVTVLGTCTSATKVVGGQTTVSCSPSSDVCVQQQGTTTTINCSNIEIIEGVYDIVVTPGGGGMRIVDIYYNE